MQVMHSNVSRAVAYIQDQPVGGGDTFQAKIQKTTELCGPRDDSTRSNNRHWGQSTEAGPITDYYFSLTVQDRHVVTMDHP